MLCLGTGAELKPARAALCRAQRAAAPLPADLMSREVAGQPEGTTLLECIEAGSVAFPERMGYVQWLLCRRETGSRPLKKRDGRSTTPEEEAALWRQVMEFCRGRGGRRR